MNIKNCEGCKGACCRYVAMEIDTPTEIEDFENIRWYVAHENIEVYVDSEFTWNIEFKTPCKYLLEDGKCSIHEEFTKNPSVKRPKICSEFTTEFCPHHNFYLEKYKFTSIEDVDNYIKNVFNLGKHVIIEEDEYEED